MNFPHYQSKVVLAYGVELVGWPAVVPFVNPGSIHRVAELETLCNAIKAGDCAWSVLDDQRWARHKKGTEGKTTGRVSREAASAATSKKMGKKGKAAAKSAEMIEESDLDDVDPAVASSAGHAGKENDVGERGVTTAHGKPFLELFHIIS